MAKWTISPLRTFHLSAKRDSAKRLHRLLIRGGTTLGYKCTSILRWINRINLWPSSRLLSPKVTAAINHRHLGSMDNFGKSQNFSIIHFSSRNRKKNLGCNNSWGISINFTGRQRDGSPKSPAFSWECQSVKQFRFFHPDSKKTIK